MAPLELTQAELAAKLGVSVQTVNLLINGRRGVTAETAIALGKTFETTPQFWMNLQTNHDIWVAQRRKAK